MTTPRTEPAAMVMTKRWWSRRTRKLLSRGDEQLAAGDAHQGSHDAMTKSAARIL
jgi:hypothetical protein